ncbi:hypothetical protein FO519_008694 [Halicephalobus sp. NKZ332]|nr:hypothetical protein FO519_008694 [Halicephalobus sp. NKZ332]
MSEAKMFVNMDSATKKIKVIINAATRLNIMKEISVPRIVVVGTESTGKTSLINRIVNKDFLPSGAGIVTKMPIKIGLIHTPLNDPEREKSGQHGDWATINKESKFYTDFNEVSNRLREIMNEKAGKGVRDAEITVNIYSENAVNLTLVDLPGLVTNETKGQPHDIPKQIEDMVTKYISDPNTIILCVLPANYAKSNWPAEKLAKKVDPNGERTLGALTHIDSMVTGTNANEILADKDIIKLGMVGIRNRNQTQLDRISIDQIETLEKNYFKSDYSEYAHECGIKFLRERLNELLEDKVEKNIPTLMKELEKKQRTIKTELDKLGVKEDIRSDDCKKKLRNIIIEFNEEYKEHTYDGSATIGNNNELPCTKIRNMFYKDFERMLPTDHERKLMGKEVKTMIENSNGLNNLSPHKAFNILCEEETKRYCEPSVECARYVQHELLNGINTCTGDVKHMFKKYPQIKKKFHQIIKELLDSYFQESEKLIKIYIESLASYSIHRYAFPENVLKTESPTPPEGKQPASVFGLTVNNQPAPVSGLTVNNQPTPVSGLTVNNQPAPVSGLTVNNQPASIFGLTVNNQPASIFGLTVNNQQKLVSDNVHRTK